MGDINRSERSEARGLHDLPQLNSAFNSNRRERPPMIDLATGDIASRVPLRQPKVQRKDSKGGLRGMFTRTKTERAVAISPLIEETTPLSGHSERSMKAVAEASLPRTLSMRMAKQKPEKSSTVTEILLPATPAEATAKSSRINLRSKSVKSTKTPSKPIAKSSSTKSSPRPPPRTSAAWDPPPLFQAYPQAIKYAQLSASTLSADAILRISNHKRNNSLRDEIAQIETTDLTSAAAKKAEKARSKHKRHISGSLSKADWTQKIYVLVTSGYLLQYAGDGSFDRLPEKMMQLGKDSVAFASDVIPGKHWVLQISQAMDPDGTPASDSRSLLSRLAFRGADYRRSATSLLLVLDSAEDMDSWIAVVRREIEALGGKKHVSETGKPKPDDKVMQLRAQPSHRYLIHKNTDVTSDPTSPRLPSFGPPPWVKQKDEELQKKLEEATSELIRPQLSIRPSTSHHSRGDSFTSNNGRQLEGPRDSSNRFSYVSSGQRTLITSQGSSPATSPTRESANFDEMIPRPTIADVHLRPSVAAGNERRRSMQTIHAPLLEPQTTVKLHRHSTYGGPTNLNRSRSPGPTPNFSVPNCSIKRYSIPKSPSPTPPVPSTAIRSGQQDSVARGTHKAPSAPLHIPRPLSPIKASPKKAALVIFSSMDSDSVSDPSTIGTTQSFSLVQNAKPSMIIIPPRSPGTATTPVNAMSTPPPRRMSSLTPLAPHEAARIDFHLPRRYSSMQTLREISEKQRLNNNNVDAPLRPAPLPPAALSTPLPSSPFVSTTRFPEPTAPQGQNQNHAQTQYQPHAQSKSPRSRASAHSPQPVPIHVPVLANTKSKVRRPISMQIAPAAAHRNNPYLSLKTKPSLPVSAAQSDKLSPRPFSSSSNSSSISTINSPTTTNGHVSTPLSSASLLSPSLQRVKDHELNRTVINRRSMPALVNGPPPAPPPDCALPPLPPPGSARGSVGSRGSMVR